MAQAVQEKIIDPVSKIRHIRGEMNIPPSEAMDLVIVANNQDLSPYLPYIKKLARIGEVTVGEEIAPPKRAAVVSTSWGVVYILLSESRVQKEIGRLEKVLQKMEKEVMSLDNRLGTSDFTKAPGEVQRTTRLRYDELTQTCWDTKEQLSRFRESVL